MINAVRGARLLFIEDNAELRRSQAEYFKARGNEVYEAETLGEAKNLLNRASFNAVVLDLLLPDGEGLEIFDWGIPLPPVIIQTTLSGDCDMLDGFSAGACDYVVKPCPAEVLEARLSLRMLPKADSVISMHGLTVDLGERVAKYENALLSLTGSEFNLLHFFIAHAGEFYSAAEIYENVWKMPSLKSTAVKYHIFNLRQKLIAATGKQLILTEFGKGYCFIK